MRKIATYLIMQFLKPSQQHWSNIDGLEQTRVRLDNIAAQEFKHILFGGRAPATDGTRIHRHHLTTAALQVQVRLGASDAEQATLQRTVRPLEYEAAITAGGRSDVRKLVRGRITRMSNQALISRLCGSEKSFNVESTARASQIFHSSCTKERDAGRALQSKPC